MKRFFQFFFIALITLSVSGCMVSSNLSVTNSTSLVPGTYVVVKPLNEEVTSTHFLGLGGWKVRDFKETVIQKWHRQLGPNQALADIHFTESVSHFIPFVFYQERLYISGWIVEPKSSHDGPRPVVVPEPVKPEADDDIVETIPLQEEISGVMKTWQKDIPDSIRRIELSDGSVIVYDEKEPIAGQVLDGLEAIKKDYKKYTFKSKSLKTSVKVNIDTLQQWYELSGVKSSKIEKALKEANDMLSGK